MFLFAPAACSQLGHTQKCQKYRCKTYATNMKLAGWSSKKMWNKHPKNRYDKIGGKNMWRLYPPHLFHMFVAFFGNAWFLYPPCRNDITRQQLKPQPSTPRSIETQATKSLTEKRWVRGIPRGIPRLNYTMEIPRWISRKVYHVNSPWKSWEIYHVNSHGNYPW